MPVPLQVLLGFVIVVLAVLLGLRRRPRPVTPPSADLVERLRTLVARDQRLQAIKELRRSTNLSLVDARNYVDELPPTGPIPPLPPRAGSPGALDTDTAMRAREHIAAGRYVHAVKVVREDTGWSLKQAKDATDRLRDG
jgi:large subunit ribosomal protein L7/L12